MQTRLPPLTLLSLAAMTAASNGHAMGLGQAPASIPLSQPLNVAIPLYLEPSESLDDGCVKAVVVAGEAMVAPSAVRATVETRGDGPKATHWVRLQTTTPIEEPVVQMSVSLGCPVRMTRSLVSFVDPAQQVNAADKALMAGAGAAVPAAATANALQDLLVAATNAGEPANTGHEHVAAHKPVADRRVKPTGAAKPALPGDAAPAKPAKARSAKVKPEATTVQATAPANPPTAAGGNPARPKMDAQAVAAAAGKAPRLKLDTFEAAARNPALAVERDQTLAKAESSAAAALAASDALSSISTERFQALEKDLAKARSEAQANRDLARNMRTKLAEAENQGDLMPALGTGMAVLFGLAAWLGWRVRGLEREKRAAWWNGQGAEAAEPMPSPVTEANEPDAQFNDGAGSPHALAGNTEMPSMRGTDAAAEEAAAGMAASSWQVPEAQADDAPTAEAHAAGAQEGSAAASQSSSISVVSIESLIDLEQQTDFFAVLGQDDSAIDLLRGHLEEPLGLSPMVHLKLLEVYRRTGDAEAFELANVRMQAQFQVAGPSWDGMAEPGLGLAAHPDILMRLQEAWDMPIQAMAELEGLMFGPHDGRLLDLPAYREALTLYGLVRDALEHGEEPLRPALFDSLAGGLPENPSMAHPAGAPNMHQAGQRAEFEATDAPDTGFDAPTLELPTLDAAPTAHAQSTPYRQDPGANSSNALPVLPQSEEEITAPRPYLKLELPKLELDLPAPQPQAPAKADSAPKVRGASLVDFDLGELKPTHAPRMAELTLEPAPEKARHS